MKPSSSPRTKRRAGQKARSPRARSEKPLEAHLRTERELEQARDYAEAIVEAAPPLLVLDGDLRVRSANQPFCKCFKISPDETVSHLVYELGNGQWNIPKLRTLLEEVLPKEKSFKDFEAGIWSWATSALRP